MFIVDRELKKVLQEGIVRISVDEDVYPPFDPSTQIGPGSIDLRLGQVVRKYKQQINEIDLTQKDETEIIEIPLDKEFIIRPGELFLGVTVEIIFLPANMLGIISPRSSIARLGLSVAEQILMHPGHSQAVALQLTNKTDRPIRIKPLLPICQITLFQSTSYAEKPYQGKYLKEAKIPLPSGIGVELGLEKEEQLTRTADVGKFHELQRNSPEHARNINLITTFLLVVSGGCFPIIIQEFHTQPFPSAAFITSTILLFFCTAFLWILHWKREDKNK